MFSGRIDRLGLFLGFLYSFIVLIFLLLLTEVIVGTFVISPSTASSRANSSPDNACISLCGDEPTKAEQDRSYRAFILYVTSFGLWGLFYLLITLSLLSRRLHDINQSEWLSILGIVPFVGLIFILVLLVARGDAGTNQYGKIQTPRNLAGIFLGRYKKLA